MTTAFLDFLGWNGLTAAEQAAALAGAGLGLAAWLLARARCGGAIPDPAGRTRRPPPTSSEGARS